MQHMHHSTHTTHHTHTPHSSTPGNLACGSPPSSWDTSSMVDGGSYRREVCRCACPPLLPDQGVAVSRHFQMPLGPEAGQGHFSLWADISVLDLGQAASPALCHTGWPVCRDRDVACFLQSPGSWCARAYWTGSPGVPRATGSPSLPTDEGEAVAMLVESGSSLGHGEGGGDRGRASSGHGQQVAESLYLADQRELGRS